MNTQSINLRQILAAVIGNALEFYDFLVFGFVSVVISRLFFPTQDEYAGLLFTFATFGVGFFMRPVGAIVLGLYADRAGRKPALQLIVLLMTISMAMIAFAPTYEAIGIGAPVLIVLARLLQGFATGGEFSSATSFLIESAPAARRGLYGSFQMVGQGLAALCGTLAGSALSRGLDVTQLNAWGWRIPFLLGLLIGPIGLYMRRNLLETQDFQSSRQAGGLRGVGAELVGHRRGVLVAFLVTVCGTTAYFVVLLYMPTYAKTQLGISLVDALSAQLLSLTWLVILIPVFGALSDRIGRRPILAIAALLYFLLPYPLFDGLLAAPTYGRLLAVQVSLCTVIAALSGVLSTTVAEQFPTSVRSTGTAIAYNFAVAIFGGSAPFFVTWLIHETGSQRAPAFYIMFGAAAGIAASLLLKEKGAQGQI